MSPEGKVLSTSSQSKSSNKITYWALALSVLLITVLLLPFGAEETHWALSFLGQFHPLFVHLPIGILLGLFVLEVLNFFRPELKLQPACGILLWLAVITSVPTVIFGKLLAVSGGYGSQLLSIHKWFGLFTALLSIWLLVLRRNSKPGGSRIQPYQLALLVNVIALSITGHYGGSLTHGSNYLTKNLPDEIREFLGDYPYALDGLLAMESSKIDKTLETYKFASDLQPILKTHCYECHGEKEQKGGLRLDDLDPDMVHGADAEVWRGALDMINSGEMPPDEKAQPSDEERRVLVDWITASIHQAVEIRKAEQKPVIRRLTKNQYSNSVSELLNTSVRYGEVLPDDAKSEMGFTNNGQVLQISPLHIDYYKQIAREALDKAIAPETKPEVTHYRVTFGKEIGKNKTAGFIRGYQSAPIDTLDFVVEVLDEDGNEVIATDSASRAALNEIKKNIGVGMRGSDADRYQVVDEGIILYSALPHKEVTPKSWQGPSPNLKLLFRNVFPMEGDFQFRVKASKGYQWYTQRVGFISLRSDEHADVLPGRIVLKANASKTTDNLALRGNRLMPKEVTNFSRAVFEFEAPSDGYYQIDFRHPYVPEDAMPSMNLRVDRHFIQERLHLEEPEDKDEDIVTPVTLAYLEKGSHRLQIGGRFFVGFSEVNITPYPEDHPLTKQLKSEAEQSRIKYDNDIPVIRTFAGARTDDGMDYKTFDEFQNVDAKLGELGSYTFNGRLENLPIPMIDTVETEILANIMVIGLWNDFLVKDNHDSGPPLLIKEIEFEAPYYPEWPPKSHAAIFFPNEKKQDEEAYTRDVLQQFMEKAFRRPVEEREIDMYFEFWKGIKGNYDRYEDGVKEALIAILCSPNFIYLAEPEEGTEEEDQEFFLASRLSYFLWNTAPDETLLTLAKKEKLHRKSELRRQVQRMIEDDRSWNMIKAFSEEWLRIDRHESMSTNVGEYENFTRFVKQDMKEETFYFMKYVLDHNLSICNLIESNFAMLNQNLAEFYGIDSVKGSYFRAVPVSAELHRGGLLSQGAFLSGHSDGTQAHAIKRAVWLKSRILGDRPADPPPNVPELDPDTPGFENLTLKEQLFLHRDKASCMDCHRKIDPYGIVFENYDAVGIFKTVANEKPIDTRAELPDGRVVDGIDEIKAYILNEKRDDFTRSLVKHLFAYALGRDITFVDEREIESIVRKVRSEDYKFQTVFEEIVLSKSFRGDF